MLRLLSTSALLAVLLLAGCRRHATSTEGAAALPTVVVQTAPVTADTTSATTPLAGTVRVVQRATLAARVSGTVGELPLTLGQAFAAGDVLVTLQADEYAARVDQARAQLAHAAREHEREQALSAQGAATAESVRALADRRQAAAATLAEAETMVSYTRLVAPFAGVLVREWVRPGDLATPGTPLVAIEGAGLRQVEVAVPESLLTLPVGTTVLVESNAGPWSARLAEVSPAGESASRSRLAKLDLPAESPLASGQFVRVLWPAAEARHLTIPASAVTLFGQMQRVFVVDGQHARLRLVRTGGAASDRLVVLSGLDEGESVVLNPPAHLRDGQPLDVLR